MRARCLAFLTGMLVVGTGLLPACAVGREPQPRRQLSPDSMEVLERAILRARPAYRTHAQALRAGIYGDVEQPAALAAEPAAAAPESPRPSQVAATGGSWVIQVGAYESGGQADAAAAEARRRFPDVSVIVERGSGAYRVALSGWPSAGEAERRVGEVRRVYPDAWVRERRP